MPSVRSHPICPWEVASWILLLPAINLRNSTSEHTEFDHNLLRKVSVSVWIYWLSPLKVSDGKIYLSYIKNVAFGTQLKSFNQMKFSFICVAAHMKFNRMNSVREDEKVISTDWKNPPEFHLKNFHLVEKIQPDEIHSVDTTKISALAKEEKAFSSLPWKKDKALLGKTLNTNLGKYNFKRNFNSFRNRTLIL